MTAESPAKHRRNRREQWARRLSIALPLLPLAVASIWYALVAVTSPGPYAPLIFLVVLVYGFPVVLVLGIVLHIVIGVASWSSRATKMFVSCALVILLYLPAAVFAALYALMFTL
ncbi:hypothetical protein [Pseudoclavibacter sp. 13-3]|uniref:hypothetical protein n=1 Tax=Pseudoclavibacter sp. 13-3 TaxID=2901228 RepID=UPI001E2E5B95|nr:hypothetical protein [Pseudoclavibacter sp. 13-3]MCD7101628.1 hypothetical protein [Pseudoclavibacter sp. 13-3]